MVQSLSKHVCNKYQQQFQTADFKQTNSKYTSLVRNFFVQLFMRTDKRISFFHCTASSISISHVKVSYLICVHGLRKKLRLDCEFRYQSTKLISFVDLLSLDLF